MERILEKIKEHRKKKGYSYETMAQELNTSPGAYRKIELNQTKLTVEKLQQISSILEAKIEDLLDIKADKIYNQELNDNSIGHQEVQNLYQDNSELKDKIIEQLEIRIIEKNEMIQFLKESK